MFVFVRTQSGITFTLEVDREETISDVILKICEQDSSLSPAALDLMYGGKRLEGHWQLSHYNIEEESSLNMMLQPPYEIAANAKLATDHSTDGTKKERERKAEIYDFDEDLHIIDPESHFRLLKNLEKQVFEASEFVQNGSYVTSIEKFDEEVETIGQKWGHLPNSVYIRLVAAVPIWKKSHVAQQTLDLFGNLLKIFTIVHNVCCSLRILQSQRFCFKSINILRKHEAGRVIQFQRIDCIGIEFFEASMSQAVNSLLQNLTDDSLSIIIKIVIPWCQNILFQAGLKGSSIPRRMGSAEALILIRTTALLLDIALISYVGSHSFHKDMPLPKTESTILKVLDGDEPYGFKCTWNRLACLDDFLDIQKVLVFDFLDKFSKAAQEEATSGSYILARMADLADFWGPVHAISSATGQIKFYGVSKGVICRVEESPSISVPGAVQCHYIKRSAFLRQKTSRLLSGDEQLFLAEGDLLLIGGGLVENLDCKYTITDFLKDYSSDVTVLGTSESVWKTDTRSVAVGFTKYFGVSVTGSQKLAPQTTLKQHILDKWTTNPSRANPGILNQYLGVEISHCTGNARRITLRKLMTLPPIWSLLECQHPDWTKTPWGHDFSAALQGSGLEDIFRVWKKLASYRASIAELVCCVLELLDQTGRRDQDRFQAAFMHQGDESACSIENSLNNWSIALEDTHLTCAYVAISERCLDCRLPNHSASSCHLLRGYTVLQTEIAVSDNANGGKDRDFYALKPSGQRLKLGESGGSDILVLEPDASSRILAPTKKYTEIIERCNRQSWTAENLIYFKASRHSFHGKLKPRLHSVASTQQNSNPPEVSIIDPKLEQNQDFKRTTHPRNDPENESTNSNSTPSSSRSRFWRQSPKPNHATSSKRLEVEGSSTPQSSASTFNHLDKNIHSRPSEVPQSDLRNDAQRQLSKPSLSIHRMIAPNGEDLLPDDIFGQDFYAPQLSTSNGLIKDLANSALENRADGV